MGKKGRRQVADGRAGGRKGTADSGRRVAVLQRTRSTARYASFTSSSCSMKNQKKNLKKKSKNLKNVIKCKILFSKKI